MFTPMPACCECVCCCDSNRKGHKRLHTTTHQRRRRTLVSFSFVSWPGSRQGWVQQLTLFKGLIRLPWLNSRTQLVQFNKQETATCIHSSLMADNASRGERGGGRDNDEPCKGKSQKEGPRNSPRQPQESQKEGHGKSAKARSWWMAGFWIRNRP